MGSSRIVCVASLLLLPAFAGGQTGEQGNVCVQHFTPAAACLAQDVRVVSVKALTVTGTCLGNGVGTVDVELQLALSTAGGPDRYDIGMFIATQGGSALSGNACYHDYLAPPLTATPDYVTSDDGLPAIVGGPWWNGEPGDPFDSCGDVQKLFSGQSTESIVTERAAGLPLTLACVDTNANNILDASICISWDNNTTATCSSVSEAFPVTSAKCGCQSVDIPGVVIPANADLAISKDDGITSVPSGALTRYDIVVVNNGPSDVAGAKVIDLLPSTLTDCIWTCSGSGTCTVSGSGNIDDTIDLPNGTSVSYDLECRVALSASGVLANTADVTPPEGTVDLDESNNYATDSDAIDDRLFADGFEMPG